MGYMPIALTEGSPIRELELVPNPVSVAICIASSGPSSGEYTLLASRFFHPFQSSESGSGIGDLLNKGKYVLIRGERLSLISHAVSIDRPFGIS